MIGDIVSQLKQSRMLPLATVQKWLEIELVMKMEVKSLPYHFWHGDSKINPAAKNLFWAAIPAGDNKNFTIIEGIIHTEYLAADKKPELQNTRHKKDSFVGRTVTAYVDGHFALAPEPPFRKLLTNKANKILHPARYP